MIAVGDALVGCNGYSLQGMDLEQAVGVMRSVGTPPSGICFGLLRPFFPLGRSEFLACVCHRAHHFVRGIETLLLTTPPLKI
jgi:hypothetical protein